MESSKNKVRQKTITDFDNQWILHGGKLDNDYWASDDVLIDQFSSLFWSNNVVSDYSSI